MSHPDPPGRPSMADVGRVAEVSAQTVSRYFTGSGYVSDEARQRIAAAVDQLGYVRNRTARNLRARSTDTVGVLSIGALNYGSTGVLTGIVRAARAAGVTVMISELDLDDSVAAGWEVEALHAIDELLSMGVDGIVVSSPVPGAREVLARRQVGAPVLLVSELQAPLGDPHRTHSYVAGFEATQHLLALGHRRVLHVAGPLARNEARERLQGYRDAMATVGATVQVAETAVDWSAATGDRAGRACDPDSFTAVVAANDEIALGFLSALEERGLRAPANFSIIGVDDMPSAAYFSPALTTMALDFAGLGRVAFEELRHRISGRPPGSAQAPGPRLVVRRSTREA